MFKIGTLISICMGLIASLVTLAGDVQSPLRPREGTLVVGDAAPDFTLATPDGKTKVTLSSFRAKKPVVLIFGSYT